MICLVVGYLTVMQWIPSNSGHTDVGRAAIDRVAGVCRAGGIRYAHDRSLGRSCGSYDTMSK